MSDLDTFDRRILNAIQSDNRLTAEALSSVVGLSPDACRKRVARLRKSGFVEADIARLNPDKLGRGLTLIVELTLQSERPSVLDQFKEQMLAAPEVMQCYYVTGNSDFIIILTARDMADFEAFTRRHFFDEEKIGRFRTSVVMNRIKTGFSIPVLETDDTPS